MTTETTALHVRYPVINLWSLLVYVKPELVFSDSVAAALQKERTLSAMSFSYSSIVVGATVSILFFLVKSSFHLLKGHDFVVLRGTLSLIEHPIVAAQPATVNPLAAMPT